LNPDTSGGIAAASAVIDWYDRIKKHFEDFRPETRSMTINFTRCTSEMSFKVTVPEGWRKRHNKIVLPAYGGSGVVGMMDDSFNDHKHLWRRVGSEFVLDADNLPSAETYLVTMEGSVSRSALDRFVYIKPAANRTTDDTSEKYWLESGLRNLRTLESVYDDLKVDDINFNVSVSIDKMFGLTIPPDIQEQAKAVDGLRRAALHTDRQAWFHAMRSYKAQSRILPGYDPRTFRRLVDALTSREIIAKYVTVDRPYGLGEIRPPEKYHGIVPQSVTVSAVTSLTLRDPAATGYLSFNKKSYIEKLRSEFAMPGGMK